jgi:hypothetical protein
LDLHSGVLENASYGVECARLAEMYARASGLAFGTLWLFPGLDGLWHFGGFDPFPPQRHACGDEMALAAAICDRYG